MFPFTELPQMLAAAPGSTPPHTAVIAPRDEPPSAVSAPPAPKPTAEKPSTPMLLAFQAPQGRTARFAVRPARLSSVPTPPDPYEPVTGPIQVASPVDRGAALALLERARQNALTHRAGTPPFRLEVSFSAGGHSEYTGTGHFTETWLSGQKWLWTANLGAYSGARSAGFGMAAGEKYPGVIPMRIQMLRNAIFWAVVPIPDSQIRVASVQWNGRPATCIMSSRMAEPAERTRLWEESEHCVDNASGLLQVHWIAPGTYSVYSYNRRTQFHGQTMPDRIAIYVNGAQVIDAQVSLTDAGSPDESQLRPTPEMMAAGPAATLVSWTRFAIDIPNTSISGLAKPVIVHACVDGSGNVVEEEPSSISDPALAQQALELVKKTRFGATGTQRQMYINVRFVPVSQ